jgi:uncharacterized protein (TIGR01777 family)
LPWHAKHLRIVLRHAEYKMDIALTGATGFIGRHVADRLRAKNRVVRTVSTRTGPRLQDLEACDAVIHLAGEPVAQRWTRSARDRIRFSRAAGTRRLVQALAKISKRPTVLISASAVGYYGSRGDEILTESSPHADDFLGHVALEWEHEAQAAEELGLRVVRLRLGMVLGRHGGALARMLLPFRLGLGGRIGPGTQWMSWIHIADLVSLISFALETPQLSGPVNASAPNPVTNADFTQALADTIHRRARFTIPLFALKLLYGRMAEILYASQRAIPEAALKAGFQFQFPEIGEALEDLLSG